jgi:crotonobetainyl-CoA:carnitine CoA-transferase CaiB-like acyl-CoA transferase
MPVSSPSGDALEVLADSCAQRLLGTLSVVECDCGVDLGYAGKLLADAGARVSRIRLGGAGGDPDLDAYFSAGKRVVEGGDVWRALDAAGEQAADVYLIGVGGERGRRSGFAPEQLARRYPDSVIVVVTPFGWHSSRRFDEYDDVALQALSGVSLYIGEPGRPPLRLPFEQSTYQAGLIAAIAALSELGESSHEPIDLSIADIWASFYSGPEAARARFSRGKSRRGGHRALNTPFPREIVPCADGFFAVQCQNRRHWQGLLEMVCRPELAGLPLFQNRVAANNEHLDEAEVQFADFYAIRTKAELLELFVAHKLPGAPVYDVSEVLDSEQLRERGFFSSHELDVPGGQATVRLPGSPFAVTAAGNPVSDAAPRPLPLTGLRVVDFGWVWAGAVPGHILAMLGAEVIKIESRARLDYMRQGKPIVGTERDPEQNPMFQAVNGGKRSATIDFTDPAGAEILRSLVAASDVVIENFTPGVLDKHGLGWSQLSAVNPNLIMCAMSPAGQQGPLRGLRTYATMIASLSGMDSVVGYPGERVLGMQQSYPDPNASLHGTFALLAALQARRAGQTGGCYLDLSQWESGAALVGGPLARNQLTGEVPSTAGVWRQGCAPIGNYPCAGDDVWLALAVRSDAEWDRLLEVLAPPWRDAWQGAGAAARYAERARLDGLIASATARWDARELERRLTESGIPASRCLSTSELLEADTFRERRLFQDIEHHILGPVTVYGLPWLRGDGERPAPRVAPTLGADNAFVLSELLGLDEALVKELLASPAMNA